jgi:hypothetical protein
MALVLGLLATAVVGCSDAPIVDPLQSSSGQPQPSSAVASVSVKLDSTTIVADDSVHATVVATDPFGKSITDPPITWTSLDSSVATVSTSGFVIAHDTGTTAIRATVEGKVGEKTVVVQPRKAWPSAPAPAPLPPKPGPAPIPTPPAPAPAPAPTSPTQPASTQPPQSPTPAATGPSVLASNTFENGLLAPFTNPYGADIDVVNDPTGSGHGKVARFHYVGSAQDRNRSLMYEKGSGVGLGQTMHFSGEFYLPVGINASPLFAARKLLYFQPDAAFGKNFFSVITMYGTAMSITNGYVSQSGATVEEKGPTVPVMFLPGRWYKIETQLTLNTSFTAKDGVYRCWIDPSWTASPTAQKFRYVLFGDQVNSSGRYDEYRYWDNVTFSTVRVAP